jgi:hypothetical protein
MMRQGRIFAHLQSPQRHGYAAAGLHEHVLPPMPDVRVQAAATYVTLIPRLA